MRMANLSSFVFSKTYRSLSRGTAQPAALQGAQVSPHVTDDWSDGNLYASFHATEYSSLSRKVSTNKPLLKEIAHRLDGCLIQLAGQSSSNSHATKTLDAIRVRVGTFLRYLALLSVIVLLLCCLS
jgi:hypothetical protein